MVRTVVMNWRPANASRAANALWLVSRLAAWFWESSGETEPRKVLHPATIARFVASRENRASATSNRVYAQQLRVIAAATLEKSTSAPRPVTGNVARPYIAREVAALSSWAHSQSTLLRRRNGKVLLALALGAGLRSREIEALRRRDLEHVGGSLLITVAGNPSRTVPVLRAWIPVLLERLATMCPDDLLFQFTLPTPRTQGVMWHFAVRAGAFRPDPERLRSTWIVAQLNSAIPIVTVLAAAGFKSSFSLDRFLPFVHTDDSHRALLAEAVIR